MKNNLSFAILATTVMAGLVLSLVDANSGATTTNLRPEDAPSTAVAPGTLAQP